MIRNVILDWSGTLVDDLDAVVRATNAVLSAYGAPPVGKDQFRRELELPLARYYGRVLPGVPLRSIDEVYHEAFRTGRESVCLFPEAEVFLGFCRGSGRRLFVLSTMQADHFDAQSKRLGLRGYFDRVYVGVADKSDQLAALLRTGGLDAEETVFIGDMAHDVEAAKAAGVLSAAVLTGFDPVEKLATAGPDLLLRNLGVLQRLWGPNPAGGEWVEIVDLEVSTRIGVPDAERAAPQKLWLDISFQIARPFIELEDDVGQTIDYAAVARAVTDFASEHECRLIETLAAEVAGLVERRFSALNVSVTVKKVILPSTRCVQVRTGRRPRAG